MVRSKGKDGKGILWNVAKTPDHKDIYNVEKYLISSFAEVKPKKILPLLSEISHSEIIPYGLKKIC